MVSFLLPQHIPFSLSLSAFGASAGPLFWARATCIYAQPSTFIGLIGTTFSDVSLLEERNREHFLDGTHLLQNLAPSPQKRTLLHSLSSKDGNVALQRINILTLETFDPFRFIQIPLVFAGTVRIE